MERLPIIWELDISDKIKRYLIQAVVVSVLLFERITETQTKFMEKNLDKN